MRKSETRLGLFCRAALAAAAVFAAATALMAQQPEPATPIVIHAARLLNVGAGTVVQPGEVLVDGDRIKAVGQSVDHPQGAELLISAT